MPKFRVAVCYEEGVVIEVEAEGVAEAEGLACQIAEQHAGSDYPSYYKPETVHRDYFSQDATEVEGDDG